MANRRFGRGAVEVDAPTCAGPGEGALVVVPVAPCRCAGVGGTGRGMAGPARRGGAWRTFRDGHELLPAWAVVWGGATTRRAVGWGLLHRQVVWGRAEGRRVCIGAPRAPLRGGGCCDAGECAAGQKDGGGSTGGGGRLWEAVAWRSMVSSATEATCRAPPAHPTCMSTASRAHPHAPYEPQARLRCALPVCNRHGHACRRNLLASARPRSTNKKVTAH